MLPMGDNKKEYQGEAPAPRRAAPSRRDAVRNAKVDLVLAQGRVRNNFSRIVVVGIVLTIVAASGVTIMFVRPNSVKDI